MRTRTVQKRHGSIENEFIFIGNCTLTSGKVTVSVACVLAPYHMLKQPIKGSVVGSFLSRIEQCSRNMYLNPSNEVTTPACQQYSGMVTT